MTDEILVIDIGEYDEEHECVQCGHPFNIEKWVPIHGCGRCGVGYLECPEEDCSGEAVHYF